MQITGGSYGAGGKFTVNEGGSVDIRGALAASKSRSDIATVDTGTTSERGFGTLGFILGAPILALVGWMLAGGIGVLVCVCLAVLGSFYRKKQSTAEVSFTDGSKVVVAGTKREIARLVQETQR